MSSKPVRATTICGRADLLRALAQGRLDETAELLDYLPCPKKTPEVRDHKALAVSVASSAQEPAPREGTAENMTFWRVVAYEGDLEARNKDLIQRATRQLQDEAAHEFHDWDGPPPIHALGDFANIAAALRRDATRRVDSQDVDIPRALRRIETLRPIEKWPRQKRRRWGGEIVIIEDDSERLAPYRSDYLSVRQNLASFFPKNAPRRLDWPDVDGITEFAPGAAVVALSDLGLLARDGAAERRAWALLGDKIRRLGGRPVAILPGAPLVSQGSLASSWTLAGWRSVTEPFPAPAREEQLAQLAALAAPALSVNAALLRGLRHLQARWFGLPDDPGLETLFWQSEWVGRTDALGAALLRAKRADLLRQFEGFPPDLRRAVLRLIYRWRFHHPDPFWRQGEEWVFAEEIRSLSAPTRQLIPAEIGLRRAEKFADLARQAEAVQAPATDLAWMWNVTRRLPEHAWSDWSEREVLERRAWMALWGAARGDDPNAPSGVRVESMTPSAEPLRRRLLVQRGVELMLASGDDRPNGGSPLATILARQDEISLDTPPFWRDEVIPSFVSDFGEDAIGPWLEFFVDGAAGRVTQRMRWIPPGKFMMGSREDEHGRYDDESPQHEVTIGRGFWLFDTACTQALWTSVMGDNPSRFKEDANNPVENVSWKDAQAFIEKINARISGLNLCLPSEAQWEYACRAGATTPFSCGEDISPDQVNYDGNYPYRDGAKGLYRQKTVPASSLPANGWGFYEMHGNVLEWCADTRNDDYRGAPMDGSVWEADNKGAALAERVLRGGSWNFDARNVRSAYRGRDDPEARLDDVGFRCARVQDGAEPGAGRRIRQAERRIAATPSGGEGATVRLFAGAEGARQIFPRGGPFVIRSDCERLTVESLTKPDWAAAIGRDRYGLWTRIEVEGQDGPVGQRLRWINPGRFMMGSPEGEHDRFSSEGPQHEVTIAQGFWLFDTACTQALWEAVVSDNPSRFKHPENPVENVSWNEAQTFIATMNLTYEGLNLCLPSEAQWEYACRSGTTTPFSFGEDISPAQVNYDGENPYRGGEKGLYREKTVAVSSLPANAWGLHEMHGNVWEWCADAWRDNYRDAPNDGSVWESDDKSARRVLRGGSWFSGARFVRSASRDGIDPGGRGDGVGFRCARVQG